MQRGSWIVAVEVADPQRVQRDVRASAASRLAVLAGDQQEAPRRDEVLDRAAVAVLVIDPGVRQGGARVSGRKVGLTSRPMQELLGVDEPDYGLLDDMFVEGGDEIAMAAAAAADRGRAGLRHGARPRRPGVTAATALTAIARALPAVEIVDSRVADWQIKLVDAVADNASSGLLVPGGNLRKVTDFDLGLVGVAVTRHGELVDTGAGAAVLGKPVRCVAWLASKLASFGASLRVGDIEAAYAAQWAFVQSKLDVGDKLIGAKLGLTSRAEQEAMGVTEPLYGVDHQQHDRRVGRSLSTGKA